MTRSVPGAAGPGEAAEAGFALIAVLWVMVGISALALVVQLAARDAVASARNREDLAVAGWHARGCAERARAVAAAALRSARESGPDDRRWALLDRAVAESPLLAGCDVRLRAAGAAIDVNAAEPETLRRLLASAGEAPARADSLADALLDWRDADDQPRPFGIEAEGYRALGAAPPRNGALADAREIRMVRGFEAFDGIDTLLTVEAGRVPLDRAPRAVLAALPGMSPELVARILEKRRRGEPVGGLLGLEAELSSGARDELARHYPELSTATVPEADAWIVTARSAVGSPPVVSVVELRLERAGTRTAVVRRRSWSE